MLHMCVLVPVKQWAATNAAPGEQCVVVVVPCSGVPESSRSGELNSRPSDQGATTLPSELALLVDVSQY